jgi:hypothetical protein
MRLVAELRGRASGAGYRAALHMGDERGEIALEGGDIVGDRFEIGLGSCGLGHAVLL